MIAEVAVTVGTKTLSMYGLVTPTGIEIPAISLLETMRAFRYCKEQLFTFARDAKMTTSYDLPVLIDPGEHFA